MATTGGAGGGDDDWVLLKCADHNHYSDSEFDHTEFTILTSEISSWDLSEILSHQIVTIKADRNRLVQYSSYFYGLLCGSFCESRLDCVSVRWDLEILINILKFAFGFSVDITPDNFLPLFEGALFFGVEMLLSKCKEWLIEETTGKGSCFMSIQLDDLIHMWSFGVEHAIDFIPQHCTSYLARNFMWAMCSKYFPRIPSDFLLSCIKHPDLAVESERHLADAIIGWISANAEQYESSGSSNGDYHTYLKEVRISLLPLWFVTGKRRCGYFSKFAEESIDAIFKLMSHQSTNMKNDNEAHHLKIRLSQYTKKVDLSSCPQIYWKYLSDLIFSPPYGSKTMLTSSTKLISLGAGLHDGEQTPKILSFQAVEEVDISNCPGLLLEPAVNCLSKSFPSVRVLNAAHYLNFNPSNLGQLLQKWPLLTEVDLRVDISPLLTPEISILASSSATVSPVYPANLYMSTPLHLSLCKLTLEGRVDVTDNDLKNISSFCPSLSYLNLKGCTSVTDTSISFLILRCSKLHSLLACRTSFGCSSIAALMSDNQDINRRPNSEIGKDHCISMAFKFQELHIGGCKGVDAASLPKLMSQTPNLKSLCLGEMLSVDDALSSFPGSALEMLDVTDTKVSCAALAHIVSRNSKLKCLRAKGCTNLFQHYSVEERRHFPPSDYSYNWYTKLVKTSKLEEIALGWGFSSFSLQALKPAIPMLRTITVGLGATLGPDALEFLPTICPLLESVILYFQVISDGVLINLIGSLRHLQVLALCHCLGEVSPTSFKSTMPNLRKLQLERVTPWMTNDDLVTLVQNCPNLVELFLIGCRLLNSDSQQIISSGWPGLISIHLEDCGEVTVNGISSLFECKAVEDILLRHNGAGIQRDFILHVSVEMPLLRKISVDVCDSVDGDFDIPNVGNRRYLSMVKIARCKPQRCSLDLQESCRRPAHKESLVMVWDSKGHNRVVVKERL